MDTLDYLISIYKKPLISFNEVCECIGIKPESGRVMRCKGTFPIPIRNRRPLMADLRDVAEFLDRESPSKSRHTS